MSMKNAQVHHRPPMHKIPKTPPQGYHKVHGNYGKNTVYTNDKYFISADIDQHNGGYWKVAQTIDGLWRRKTRKGTFNADLTERIGR